MSCTNEYHKQLILSTVSDFNGPFTYRSFISELFSRGLKRIPSQGTFVRVMRMNKDRFERTGKGVYERIS